MCTKPVIGRMEPFSPISATPLTVSQTYTYDNANRLTNTVETGHWGRGFDYDAFGSMWVDPSASRT